jgi:hypothetical protein
MKKKTFKTAKASSADSIAAKPLKKKALPEHLKAHSFQAGNNANPAGRPKGSRNKFSEMFVQDFIEFWSENGATAFQKALNDDPCGLVKVAASIIPKDFNLNLTNEADLDKLLDKFSIDQLRDLAAGLVAIGAVPTKKDHEAGTAAKPDILH